MYVPRVTLVPDTLRPDGRGTRDIHRCAVRHDGAILRAYAKPLSADQIAAECFSALLFRAWGLTTPTPAIVEVAGKDWFCSFDATYPDLKQRMGIHAARSAAEWQARVDEACAVACRLSTAPLATAADEAISNGDRNLGNILWDGMGDPVWIDHERAFGLPDWQDANQLVTMAINSGHANDLQRAAIARALALAHDAVDAVESGVPGSGRFAHHVRRRLSGLGGKVSDRFPAPEHDLFSTPR